MESIAERTAEVSRMADFMTVAIDGPVASGKTTVGELVATRLGARFLDTGIMYRAVTVAALDRGVDYNDVDALSELVADLRIRLTLISDCTRLEINGRDVTQRLREPAVDHAVSPVSEAPSVRRALVARQREIAAEGPVVMVGRDIGSKVLPDAILKVYLDAPPEVRALRRRKELAQKGEPIQPDTVLQDLLRRDRIDSKREDSPLKPDDDAIVIDTSAMTIDQVVQRVLDLVAVR